MKSEENKRNLLCALCRQGVYAFGASFEDACKKDEKDKKTLVKRRGRELNEFLTKSSLCLDIRNSLNSAVEKDQLTESRDLRDFPKEMENVAESLFGLNHEKFIKNNEAKYQYFKILKMLYLCTVIYADDRLFNRIINKKIKFLKGENKNKRIKNEELDPERYRDALGGIVDLFRSELLEDDICDIETKYAFLMGYNQIILSEALKSFNIYSISNERKNLLNLIGGVKIEAIDKRETENIFYASYFKMMLLQLYRILDEAETFLEDNDINSEWCHFEDIRKNVRENFDISLVVDKDEIEKFIKSNIDKLMDVFFNSYEEKDKKRIKSHIPKYKKCIMKYCNGLMKDKENNKQSLLLIDIIAIIFLYERGKDLKIEDKTFITNSKSISVRNIMECNDMDTKGTYFEGNVHVLFNTIQIIFRQSEEGLLAFHLILKNLYKQLKAYCMIEEQYIPNPILNKNYSFLERILIAIEYFKTTNEEELFAKENSIRIKYMLTFDELKNFWKM